MSLVCRNLVCLLLLWGAPAVWAGSPADLTLKSGLKPAKGLTTIFPSGQDMKWRWTLSGTSSAPPAGTRLGWTAEAWDGFRWSGEKEIGQDGSLAFDVPAAHQGWSTLRAELKDAGGAILAKDETTFVVGGTPERGARNFRYGVIGGMRQESGETYQRAIEAIDLLGVDIVRGDFTWNAIQPGPGEWQFGRFDRVVEDLKKRNIDVEGILCYTVQWASTGNRNSANWLDWAHAMPDLGLWLNYVRTTVGHYKDSVKYWEVWNEPDISFWLDTQENYVRLFDETSRAIHSANPKAVVLNGGLALARMGRNVNMPEYFIAHADRANWDIRAYHDYNTFQQMLARNREHLALYRQSPMGKNPVWINEGGHHTLVPDGDRQQAINLVKKMAAAPSLPGVSAYIWYNLNDIKPEGNDPENRFGLVDYYFRPKPAYGAYQNLIRELAPRRFVPRTGDGPKGVWMFLYAGQDEHRLVLWQEGGKGAIPTLLHWPAGDAEVTGAFDMMGNDLPVVHLAGKTIVTISNEPIFLRVKGSTAYPQTEKFLDLPDTLPLLPATTPEVSLSLKNPSERPMNAEVSARVENAPGEPVTSPVNLAAGEARRISLALPTLPEGRDTGRIEISVKPEGADGAIRAMLAYEKAHVIPRRSGENGGLAFDLNQATNIVNLFDTLGRSDQAWKGPSDLSARAEMSYDDEGLQIVVTATDDRHFQEEKGAALWKGDSLQLAMRAASPGAGLLELVVASGPNGTSLSWVEGAPPGSHLPTGSADPAQLPVQVETAGEKTIYRITIPWKILGHQHAPEEGFRLNFLVNDNDGDGRRQWVELSPGIGKQKDSGLFPLFICK